MQAYLVSLDELQSAQVWHLCSDTEPHDIDVRAGSGHLRLRCLVSNFANNLHLAFTNSLESQTCDLDLAWDGRDVRPIQEIRCDFDVDMFAVRAS